MITVVNKTAVLKEVATHWLCSKHFAICIGDMHFNKHASISENCRCLQVINTGTKLV